MAGYFVCGFQVVFIGVHMPSYLKDHGLTPGVATTALRYYDEALASCERPLRVALVYDHELVDDVHPEAHDQRVDVVLTPARTVDLRPR